MKLKVAQLVKEEEESAKSNLAIQKKEEEQKQALERKAAKAKKYQDKEEKKRVTAAKTQSFKKLEASPRKRVKKHSPASPTSSTSSAVTQGGHQKVKINEPRSIQKKLSDEFDAAIDLVDQEEDEEVTGIVTKGAYISKVFDSDSYTGRSIVADAKFVTESVEIDFSKEDAQHDFRVIFQKVTDTLLICNTTLDDLDAICFMKIIEDFKVSNFGHIFSETRFPKKAEHLEFLEVKLLVQCSLAIHRSKWKLPDTVWFDQPWNMGPDRE